MWYKSILDHGDNTGLVLDLRRKIFSYIRYELDNKLIFDSFVSRYALLYIFMKLPPSCSMRAAIRCYFRHPISTACHIHRFLCYPESWQLEMSCEFCTAPFYPHRKKKEAILAIPSHLCLLPVPLSHCAARH